MSEAPTSKGGSTGGLARGLSSLMRGGRVPMWLWRRILLLVVAAVIFIGSAFWAFSCSYRYDAYAESPILGAPGVTRTRGAGIRNPLLYPPELQGQSM